jgi:hypothetical protein
MHLLREALSWLLLVGVCLAVLRLVAQLPSGDTASAYGTAVVVVLISTLSADFWNAAVLMVEKPRSIGSRMRSVYFKTLITQLTIMVAANISQSGIPVDSKNGYLRDFYDVGAGFMMRVALVEAVVPSLLSLLAPEWRLLKWLYGSSGSAELRRQVSRPPSYLLAERCASLMRIVIICCTFSNGFPLLNFATAAAITAQLFADRHALTHTYRMQPAGSELPRSIEFTLVFSLLLKAFMSWMMLHSLWSGSGGLVTRGFFAATALLLLWTYSGYLSWKCCRGRDCCCGLLLGRAGKRRGSARGSSSSREASSSCGALLWLHRSFLQLLLGWAFFEKKKLEEQELAELQKL